TSTTMCIEAPSDGMILFVWDYVTMDVDGPYYHNFGYSISGVFTQLTDDGGADEQSGQVSITLSEGDIFCFVQNTIDDAEGAATTISASFIFSQNGAPVVSDNCNNVMVTFEDVVTPGSCPASQSIVRTWTASDGCGNETICVQSITVQDTTAPVFTCPLDVTIQCTDDTSVTANGNATATDACDTLITITSTDLVTAGDCAGD